MFIVYRISLTIRAKMWRMINIRQNLIKVGIVKDIYEYWRWYFLRNFMSLFIKKQFTYLEGFYKERIEYMKYSLKKRYKTVLK